MAVTMHQRGEIVKEMSDNYFAECLAKILKTSTEMIVETYTACSNESTSQAAPSISNRVREHDTGRSEPTEDESEVESIRGESVCGVIDPKQNYVMLDLWKKTIWIW